MLIDALENKGACASGLPYAKGVKEQALLYKVLLDSIRKGKVSYDYLVSNLENYKDETLLLAGNNQRYRINSILYGLEHYLLKEYIKYNRVD